MLIRLRVRNQGLGHSISQSVYFSFVDSTVHLCTILLRSFLCVCISQYLYHLLATSCVCVCQGNKGCTGTTVLVVQPYHCSGYHVVSGKGLRLSWCTYLTFYAILIFSLFVCFYFGLFWGHTR